MEMRIPSGAGTTHHASDMVLAGHSNTLCLSNAKYISRAGGHLFMSNNTEFLTNNGAVLTISKIIKAVMLSAEEEELGGIFVN